MLKKGNKLYSILTGNCPKCHLESMYHERNPYRLNKLFKMYERCSHCNTKYKMEPSFFFGAMYVNYGLNVGVGMVIFAITYLILDLTLINSIIALCFVLLIIVPINLRLSRNIWINLFVKYDPKATLANS